MLFIAWSFPQNVFSIAAHINLWGKHIILIISFLKIPAAALALRTWKQKGKKERGLGKGIFALLQLRIKRFRFALIKRKPKQKIFHLLLKEKNGGRKKIKECIENFTVLVRRSVAKASGNAPTYSGFSLKKVRISSKTRSQIVRSAFVASRLRRSTDVRNALKAGFERIRHAPRGLKNNSRSRKIRFAVAKQQNSTNNGIANLFLSPIKANYKAII